MHRSDNFYAEQTLLMVSNELLGEMNEEKIIEKVLHTDLADSDDDSNKNITFLF